MLDRGMRIRYSQAVLYHWPLASDKGCAAHGQKPDVADGERKAI